jgi:hypothetical protein
MSEAPGLPSAAEARGWIGCEASEIDGDRVGEVHGFFLDKNGGEPAWLIARIGQRRKARLVAVPLSLCGGAPFGVWIAAERKVLRTAPVVDPTRPLRREHELTICAHFGIGEGVGRAAEVAGRAEDAVTAVPSAP